MDFSAIVLEFCIWIMLCFGPLSPNDRDKFQKLTYYYAKLQVKSWFIFMSNAIKFVPELFY